jgi:hypothetical protein
MPSYLLPLVPEGLGLAVRLLCVQDRLIGMVVL